MHENSITQRLTPEQFNTICEQATIIGCQEYGVFTSRIPAMPATLLSIEKYIEEKFDLRLKLTYSSDDEIYELGTIHIDPITKAEEFNSQKLVWELLTR